MRERWKDIEGHEGHYQISDRGRIKSLARMARSVSKAGREFFVPVRMRILKPGLCREYLIVCLCPRGTIAVHLLVARAFVPNPKNLPEVNHEDGVKANCHASNLAWTTRKGNLDHAVDLGLVTNAVRVKHPTTGEIFPSIKRASRICRLNDMTVSREWERV